MQQLTRGVLDQHPDGEPDAGRASRQNEDVRKISAWAAIVAVPTLITGVYGMNFDHMPELGWRLGYPFAIAVMAGICTLLYLRFRRIGWL